MTTKTQEKKENKKKALAILFCLLLSGVLVVGSMFAFFSDVFSGTQEVTAGTLVLVGSAEFYLNGSSTPATETQLECINPGDVIKAVIEVENEGSKSAWIQGSFSLSVEGLNSSKVADAFTVYEGTNTLGTPLVMSNAGDGVSFTDAGTKVLDGTYEKEDALIYSGALEDTETSMTFTIVFESTADNDFQGAVVSIGYSVKALQYRNNPSPNWANAVALISN